MLLWSYCRAEGPCSFCWSLRSKEDLEGRRKLFFVSSLQLQQHVLDNLKLILCAAFRGALESSAKAASELHSSHAVLQPPQCCGEEPVLCPLPLELLSQKLTVDKVKPCPQSQVLSSHFCLKPLVQPLHISLKLLFCEAAVDCSLVGADGFPSGGYVEYSYGSWGLSWL